jgi:cardiolipin synthase
MAKVRERVLNHPNVFHPELSPGLEWTGYLAEKLGRMPSLGGNAAEIMVDYDAILARLVAEIDRARNHVHLLYFLFATDTATAPVIAALGRAVERGVACRVLVDALGSRSALPILMPKLTALGVDVREMLPVDLLRRKRARLDLRNHRCTADGFGSSRNRAKARHLHSHYRSSLAASQRRAEVAGMSAFGTKRTWRSRSTMCAFWG